MAWSCLRALFLLLPYTLADGVVRDVRQAPVQHQALEDVHRLLQLPTNRGHYRRENLHHARRPLARSPVHGADPQSHAAHSRPRHRCVALDLARTRRAPRAGNYAGCDNMTHRQGLLCDLLWSDPDKEITGWSENDRGVSFTFGPDVVSRFLQKHDMDLICRAHQVRSPPFNRLCERNARENTKLHRAVGPSCCSVSPPQHPYQN